MPLLHRKGIVFLIVRLSQQEGQVASTVVVNCLRAPSPTVQLKELEVEAGLAHLWWSNQSLVRSHDQIPLWDLTTKAEVCDIGTHMAWRRLERTDGPPLGPALLHTTFTASETQMALIRRKAKLTILQ